MKDWKMSIFMKSEELEVKHIIKPSRARYAIDTQVGDILYITTKIVPTAGGSGGRNYSLSFDLYRNGDYVCDMTQNEVPRLEEIFDFT